MVTTAITSTSSKLFRHNILSLFIAGAISVIVFQMGAVAILNALGYANPPFGYAKTVPFGVPQIWSFAFWGGIWGIVFGAAETKFPEGASYYVAAFLFGAIFPVLVLWFIVLPLKGQPMAAGWNLTRMVVHII